MIHTRKNKAHSQRPNIQADRNLKKKGNQREAYLDPEGPINGNNLGNIGLNFGTYAGIE